METGDTDRFALFVLIIICRKQIIKRISETFGTEFFRGVDLSGKNQKNTIFREWGCPLRLSAV